jgi:hypothetical protein
LTPVRYRRLALALAAGLALLASAAGGQETLSTLEARVRNGPAIAADRGVRLEGPGVLRETTTDARGVAVLFHLRPGAYRFVVAPPVGGPGAACERGLSLSSAEDARVDVDCAFPAERLVATTETERDGTTLWSPRDLASLPRSTDPWSVVRDVPGVVTDRVNVGGSETAQQSLLVSHGDAGQGPTWTIDGLDVTDPAAPGFTAIYPDMDGLESVVARTGTADARVRTPGVQVSLDLRAPTDRLSGAAHVRLAPSALQSDNLPEPLAGRSFPRSVTDDVLELGASAGAPLDGGRVFVGGSFHRNALRQESFTEHEEELVTTSFTGRGRVRLGRGALSLLLLRAEKVQQDRDPTLQVAPEARWKQTGPSFLASVEDARSVGRWSVLSRVGSMDSGFRLTPQGGSGPSAFEDIRGVAQRSYLAVETERDRFQASVEGSTRYSWAGATHDVSGGTGYRRSPVSTDQSWPGNSTQGLERGGVFFRAFHLTGFALVHRGLSACSVQDELELWAQDTARWSRVSVTVGARLDRLSGHNESSVVPANPEFPDLLPAVTFGGESARIRWLDLLPRVSALWQANKSGSLLFGLRYAAYGAPLGASDVVFDNPLGSLASFTYYWIDANQDGTVERGELDTTRGRLGSSGLDPDRPASAASPNHVDPDLVAPRTHEAALRLQWSRARTLQVEVSGGFRRQVRSLWRPLLGLTRADYRATGAVTGELFGQPYVTVYYAPASPSKVAPGNGRILANRDGYAEESFFLDVAAAGRLGRRVDWRVWAGALDWRERFPDPERAVQDPTSLDTEPLQDRGTAAVRASGLGRSDLFVSARWMAGAALRGRLRWGLDAAVLATARDGYPIPYIQVASTGDVTGGGKDVLVASTLDAYRLPTLLLLDLRLSRGFRVGRGTLTGAVDVFNLTNDATMLQVARDVELPGFDRPREIVRPRIVRLGLEYRF